MDKYETILKNSFPQTFVFFCFFNLNSRISRNMCKWRHKVRNGPILPDWSSSFNNYFFLSHFFTNVRPHKKQMFSTHIFVCFLFQAPRYLETCANGVTNCKTSKRALVPLLPGEMKLDINYTTIHYNTLYYDPLHYTILHYSTLHYTCKRVNKTRCLVW